LDGVVSNAPKRRPQLSLRVTKMRMRTWTVAFCLCLCVWRTAVGTTWYVDDSVPASGTGDSWQTAFKTIQEGIDASADGDTVSVAEGIYVEAIQFNGKNVTLRSTNPLDADIVGKTIIDGNHSYPVVTFSGTEDETCVLSGFTIRNGGNGGGICGGDLENHTRATIQNNAITDNNAAQGAGIAYCDGAIQNNIITGNKSWNAAGGLTDCHGVIQNNVISGNGSFAEDAAGGLTFCNGLIQNNVIRGNSSWSMNSSGGGLAYCNGTVQNNTITGNSASRDGGGGLDHCSGTVQNNVITGNKSERGGGLAYCHGTIQGNTISGNEFGGLYNCAGNIQNNTISGNSGDAVTGCGGAIQNNTIAGNSRWGLRECNGMIVNCIIWGNTESRADQLFATSDPIYSCIEHWARGGEGNISVYPHFVDPEAGDYHLQSWSPCIDAGHPASDFSDEPEPNGGRINMGAYGNTSGAASKSPDSDADGLADDWELHWFGTLKKDGAYDIDGDGIANITEYRYGWDPLAPAERRVENLTKGEWYQTIQVTLDEADDEDEIVVYPGIYSENINFFGKNVVLRSTDPSDAGVVAGSIIDGSGPGPVVTFSGTEDETCVLSGFTIRNGGAGCHCSANGGGICGGTEDNHTRATVRNNVITGNCGSEGGGLAYCDGTIENNTITHNSAWGGGGLAHCDGTIRDNTITDNSAALGGGLWGCGGTIENNIISDNMGHGGGGGLDGCGGLIQNNVITGNWTEQDESAGGGLYGCNGTIRNNLIAGNKTRCDGGGGLAHCDGTIENNIISGNSTHGSGGGLYGCDGTIQNNTIVNNSANWASGGLANCTGIIGNCIIWGNAPAHMPQITTSSQPTYSCVQHWPGGGEGNTREYPHFVDPEGEDYHVNSWSPCIDAGDPASDYSKEPQPNGGRVNMGAYGNTAEAASRSPDTDGDALPDDWELHWFTDLRYGGASDPDGDHIPNSTEYRYAWNPTVASETLVQNLNKGLCYQTIQDALCESDDGDEIVIHPGVYYENILFLGKNVTLRSTAPSDSEIVAETILDGNGLGPVVTFAGTEDESCVLSGFTIRNGEGFYGGGICGGGAHATIRNNVITGNSADQGGGLGNCNGTIENNTIYGNSAAYGGGLAYCHGAIQNCTIVGNSAAQGMGGALHDCDGTIVNCIISGNTDKPGFQMYHSSEPTYSCIQNWVEGGEGNIPFSPHFVDPENGDFHLGSWSPCIDAGDPSFDFSNEPEPNGGCVNIGVYGNTPEAASKSLDTDSDGLPDDWELRWFGELQGDGAFDPDADRIPNLIEHRYGWDPRTASETLAENQTKGLGYQSIRLALWESADGDEIVVYPGLYAENIVFGGKNVVLRSTDPWDANVVAKTIIDGGHLGAVVTFDGSEDETCVLSGFTIQNGVAGWGGGRGAGIQGEDTHATIRSNLITGNSGGHNYGAGIYGCHGTIENNTIADNTTRWGGGLAECHGTIQNNIIARNYAHRLGGGLYACNGTVQNNTIVANSAWFGGGGLCECTGTIRNCIIWSNSAPHGPQLKDSSKPTYSCIQGWTEYGEGNTVGDPRFADADVGDFRLLPSSPCIDAGFNDPGLPETDIVGMHRIMFGGKSLTVDMGAYEYYVNDVNLEPTVGQATLRWSSLADKTYSILYSEDLLNWNHADDSVLTAGNETTFWIDDGSNTGVAPTLVPRRFYRILENP